MIAFLIKLFSFTRNVLYYAFLVSYKTGQLIIYGIDIILQICGYFYYNGATLLTVALEDFIIFLSDVTQGISFVVHFTLKIGGSIFNSVTFYIAEILLIVFKICNVLTSVLQGLYAVITKLFASTGQLFISIKYLLMLFGSGIWFALTILPLAVVYGFTLCTFYVGSFFDETLSISRQIIRKVGASTLSLTNFVMDVPLEAAAGLVAGSCIIYVLLKFHMVLYRFFKEKASSFIELTRYSIHRFQQLIYNQMGRKTTGTQKRNPRSISSDGEDNESEHDLYCVVCQDRQKCILILPCKHVCLCMECSNALREYNRMCPICRTGVEETMKVFV